MKIPYQLFGKFVTCATLLLALTSCGDDGSDGGAPSQSGTPPQASGTPTITSVSPVQNASVPVGPVTVSFTSPSYPIGTPGQNHLHFYLDTDPVPYRFYNGTGINEDNGVLYNGIHTHFVHWKSATSFDIFGLRSTAHTVRLVLADQNNVELQNTEATDTLNFSVSQPPPGNLQLQPVVTSLQFPTSLSLAPDGRVFVSEIFKGTIRIINPQWQLVDQPFCTMAISTRGNQGVLGLALDPNFAANHYVYVFYTAPNPERNRVVRYTESSGSCMQETPLLDGIPAGFDHNSGILQFGPDGKLYVSTGDGDNSATSNS